MVIVRIIGGLGNQIYQVLFCYYLKSKGFEVKIDVSEFKKTNREYSINQISKIPFEIADENDLDKVLGKNRNLKIFKAINLIGLNKKFILEKKFNINSLKQSENYYLQGYWQSELFFKQSIKFKSKILDENPTLNFELINKRVIKKINSENFNIGIHIRRGDYLNQKIKYHSIITENFYANAISKIKEKKVKSNIQFFIFSDDFDYAKFFSKKYLPKDASIISKSEVEDFTYMLNCDFLIFGNSTFSLMASLLGKSEGSIVPKFWFVDNKNEKLIFIPDNYIKLQI